MDPKDSSSLPSTTPPSGTPLPEPYIRTFAGDVDVFKRGGTPGLTPFKPTPATPVVPSAETVPVAQSDQELPKTEVGPMPAFKPIQSSTPEPLPQSVPELVVEPTPVPSDLPQKAPEPMKVAPLPRREVPEEPVSARAASPLQTYSQDFKDRVRDTQASTATVLAAEQDAGPRDEVVTAPVERSSSRWYIGGGTALILLGGIGAYVVYAKYFSEQEVVPVTQVRGAPIFVDSTEQVTGSGAALVRAVTGSVGKSLAMNTVRQLTLESSSGSGNLLAALGLGVPDVIVRNMNASGSMAGVVRTTSGQSPFFILSVTSYGATFGGMLSWELYMQRDLAALYPLYPAPTQSVASTTVATTATTTPVASSTAPVAPATPLMKAGFRDESVSNHDVRVYRDSLGRSILLYGYWNQGIMVIARDPEAFALLLGRLATSRSI